MIVYQIVGQPGAGKTTLIVDLVRELAARKLSVGTVKHSSHAHELDRPGKDSFLHRQAGAMPAAMMGRDMAAVYLQRDSAMTPATLIQTWYSHLDVVLIEGWISGPYDKIEVWRENLGKPLLFPDIRNVRAVVTDDLPAALAQRDRMRRFGREEVTRIVSFITG